MERKVEEREEKDGRVASLSIDLFELPTQPRSKRGERDKGREGEGTKLIAMPCRTSTTSTVLPLLNLTFVTMRYYYCLFVCMCVCFFGTLRDTACNSHERQQEKEREGELVGLAGLDHPLHPPVTSTSPSSWLVMK